MKFTLVYDGDLPSAGNGSRKTAEKAAIRRAFHPQLLELASVNPVLRGALQHSTIPATGQFTVTQKHHSLSEEAPYGIAASAQVKAMPTRDLYAPIQVGDRRFLPIVRESMALVCFLNILFLRKEEPGALVLQGGDLDNRIKTLFDALRMPTADEAKPEPDGFDPMYCLLESDALITGFKLESARLLSRQNSSVHEVRLVIECDVRVTHSRFYNLAFLAD
jgi:hypothetical protein